MATPDEKLDPRVADALRKMTPQEKLAMVFDANRVARQLAAAGVQWMHPDLRCEEVETEVGRRFLRAANRSDATRH